MGFSSAINSAPGDIRLHKEKEKFEQWLGRRLERERLSRSQPRSRSTWVNDVVSDVARSDVRHSVYTTGSSSLPRRTRPSSAMGRLRSDSVKWSEVETDRPKVSRPRSAVR